MLLVKVKTPALEIVNLVESLVLKTIGLESVVANSKIPDLLLTV